MASSRGIPFEDLPTGRHPANWVALWVNSARQGQEANAGYSTLRKAPIPTVAFPQDAGTVRVIAGAYGAQKGAAKTFSPSTVLDGEPSTCAAESQLDFRCRRHTQTFLVLRGRS